MGNFWFLTHSLNDEFRVNCLIGLSRRNMSFAFALLHPVLKRRTINIKLFENKLRRDVGGEILP